MAKDSTMPHRPAGFFVVRTPLLDFDVWLRWNRLGSPEARREALLEVFSAPEVEVALRTAAPWLHARLVRCRGGTLDERTETGLVAVFSRLCGRATPRGLLAGTTVGEVGGPGELRLAPRAAYRLRVQVDPRAVFRLVCRLEADPAVRAEAAWRLNESLLRTPREVKWLRRDAHDELVAYDMVTVQRTPALDRVVDVAGERALPPRAIAEGLVDDPEELSAAGAFVDGLIDDGLLLSDLEPPLTGRPPALWLLDRLDRLEGAPAAREARERLRGSVERAAALDGGSVAESAEPLGRAVGAENDLNLQLDLLKPAEAVRLAEPIVEEIRRGVRLLHRLSVPDRRSTPWTQFRAHFLERYGEGRRMPILEALDAETGIGFLGRPDPSDLLDGIPAGDGGDGLDPPPPGPQDEALLRLVLAAAERGEPIVELGPGEIESLSSEDGKPDLLPAFTVLALVQAASAEDLEGGRFRVMLDGYNRSVSSLGRLCHLHPDLAAHVGRLVEDEERSAPDAVFAEVVHHPQGVPVSQVQARPVLRGWEIPFLARSGAPTERQIPLDDLEVTVQGDEVVVLSRRLGRAVVPTMSSAHAFFAPGNLPLYRFLCGVQFQRLSLGAPKWVWRPPLDRVLALPRVVSGRLVLVPARWRLDEAELRALAAGTESAAWSALRSDRGLPRHVLLEEYDRRLPYDLDSPPGLRDLLRRTRGWPQAVLQELVPAAGELAVEGPEGGYVHELLVPFVLPAQADASARSVESTDDRREKNPRWAEGAASDGESANRSGRAGGSSGGEVGSERRRNGGQHGEATDRRRREVAPGGPPPGPRTTAVEARRRYPPGSPWIYFKLYAAPRLLERSLVDTWAPLADGLVQDGSAARWFFVRFRDPDEHLRLRLHVPDTSDRPAARAACEEAADRLLSENALWRVVLDTYAPELERYGGPEALAVCEDLFAADSRAAVAVLAALGPDPGHRRRARSAVFGIDRLAEDLRLGPEGRRELASGMRDAFQEEAGFASAQRRRLGERFREERGELEALVLDRRREGADAVVAEAYDERSRAMAPGVERLRYLARSGGSTRSVEAIAESLVHLHVNRLLRARHRLHEAVLYDFWTRLLETRWALAEDR